MRITFFTPTLKLSGGNIVMFKYAEALAQNGHDVTVIAPHNEVLDKTENGINIKTFKKVPNKYFEHIFFQLIYIKKFYDLTPPSDIIIPIFFPLTIHAIYCKKHKKARKVIALFQDFKKMYWFGKYIYFLLRLKFITDKIDTFISVSTPSAEEIKKYSGREAVVIPNGIEHEYFYPRNEEKENYLLFVGSSSKMKGLKYFLETFDIVKKDFPDIKAKIISPDKITDNPDIEFVATEKDKNKLAKLYSNAIIYVSQSLGDSFGLPPLEAMACGTAVVMTDTVGSAEYAVNNVNAKIVPVQNPEKSAEAIAELLKNEDLRKSLENEGIKTAQKYKWETAIDKFKKEVERYNELNAQ
ncbi:MAG: glycosyltransferase family 4 protein [Candidatus Gastranaerophilales bacterium]|nr:glycosyltransferase family 4 protein [Candidatus Gastranaerophilales bacterium]